MRKIFALLTFALAFCSCAAVRNSQSAAYSSDSDSEEYINIGYGRIKKSTSASAASNLEVKSGSGYSNIYDYIKGRIPGVYVNGTTIRIRGERSILGSNDPLFIVDGMEVSDIGYLSPEMVDRIDVLKDASTTAIYGARGANGVIIITTKTVAK